MEPTRWTAKAVFNWRPVLTFTRRRIELLDWFEANADPVAFNETQDSLGIAFGIPSQRLQIDRKILRAALLSPQASINGLMPALEGLWEIMEPPNVNMQSYRAAWSVPIGSSYEDARRALARRAIGLPDQDSVEAFDCACLVDVRTPLGEISLEFGVVTSDELAERLDEPGMGMMGTPKDDREPISVAEDELPQVSLFVDVRGDIRRPVKGAPGMSEAVDAAEEQIRRLVAAIGETL